VAGVLGLLLAGVSDPSVVAVFGLVLVAGLDLAAGRDGDLALRLIVRALDLIFALLLVFAAALAFATDFVFFLATMRAPLLLSRTASHVACRRRQTQTQPRSVDRRELAIEMLRKGGIIHGTPRDATAPASAYPTLSWRDPMATLTWTERRLRKEVEEIASAVRMDVWNIERYDDPATVLRMMKDKLIRSYVVFQYTFIDEYLTDIICNYYFHRPKETHYGTLWKTKRFRMFVHGLMDETFPLKKLSIVEAIKDVPTDVSNGIRRINDIRNALAHSLFPENRRRYMNEKNVTYRGTNLFLRDC
jgi:hypothetical protein